MVHDDTAPATRKDLRDLRDATKKDLRGLKEDLHTLETRMDAKLDAKIGQLKDEIFHHFDLTVENIRHVWLVLIAMKLRR